jgi:putative transposase
VGGRNHDKIRKKQAWKAKITYIQAPRPAYITLKMLPGSIYHLYNHANGTEKLYRDPQDYTLFLEKFVYHCSQVADIYSYCLMSNHFHFLVETRSEEEIRKSSLHMPAEKKISRSLANALSGYTQKINNKYDRMGSLFKPNIGRREILDENDFCSTCHYIHANPVHHGFTKTMEEWPYSSFRAILDRTQPWLDSSTVLEYFGGEKQFISYHQQQIDLKIKGKPYF